MPRLDTNRAAEMEVFVRVVDLGGFTAAAHEFRLTPSGVSKLVSRLEARLGSRLMNRSTRRLQLTPEGQAFYLRATRILADLEEAEREAAAAAWQAEMADLRGTVIEAEREVQQGRTAAAASEETSTQLRGALAEAQRRHVGDVDQGLDEPVVLGAGRRGNGVFFHTILASYNELNTFLIRELACPIGSLRMARSARSSTKPAGSFRRRRAPSCAVSKLRKASSGRCWTRRTHPAVLRPTTPGWSS